jgi:hypothetical protein
VPGGHKSKEELLKSRQKVTVEEKKFAKNLSANILTKNTNKTS